jgi:hypothetical protein
MPQAFLVRAIQLRMPGFVFRYFDSHLSPAHLRGPPVDHFAVFVDAGAAIAARPDFVVAAVSHFLVDVAEDLRADIQVLAIGYAAFAAAIVPAAGIQLAVLANVLGAA